MNTKIEYLYRDAGNYKKYNEAVVKGEFESEDLKTVFKSLRDGEFFIPEQVGLPLERTSDEITEDDHCYAELNEDSITLTDDNPTIDATWKGVFEGFKVTLKSGWNDVTYSSPEWLSDTQREVKSAYGNDKRMKTDGCT